LRSTSDRAPLSLFPVTPAWTLALNNAITAPPAYDSTRGYFSIEGDRLAAYDLTRGTQLWVVPAHSDMEPAVGDGLIFLAKPGALAALQATDGSTAWEVPFADTLAVPLVWDNGWLVAATSASAILAFRSSDGQLIWRRDIGGGPAHAPPMLAADRVYVPTVDARVVALRVDTGEPVWQHRLGGAANEILALDERLYLGSTDKFFYCLNTSDGREEWRWRTGGDAIGRPVVDERTVYFVSLDNVLRALNRNSGVQRWKSPLPLRPTSGPAKAGETIVVTGVAPMLRGFNAKDGKAAGDLPTGGEIAAPLHVFNDSTRPLPVLILLTRDIVKGATVTALTRSIEPVIAPVVPLPNAMPLAPTLPTPAPP
jgi:outer membrane protein assembly factor BamB